MKKKQFYDSLAQFAFKYDALENFCSTLKKFGIADKNMFKSDPEDGCSNEVSNYIDRIMNNEPNRMEKYENK